jgi:hypothetical protein
LERKTLRTNLASATRRKELIQSDDVRSLGSNSDEQRDRNADHTAREKNQPHKAFARGLTVSGVASGQNLTLGARV